MIQDGINFTITQDGFTKVIRKVSTDSEAKLNSGNVSNVINAVAIDWNAAQLPNSSDTAGKLQIDSTGNLLNLINEMNKRIYVLTAAVIALSNK